MPRLLNYHALNVTPEGAYKNLSGFGDINIPETAENYTTSGPDQLSPSQVDLYFGTGPNASGMTNSVAPITSLPLNVSLASMLGVSGSTASYIMLGGIALGVYWFLFRRK